MKILIDTSTLYSAMVHEGRVHDLIHFIIEKHEVVLSDYIVKELERNIQMKLSGPIRENALMNLEIFVSLCSITARGYEMFVGTWCISTLSLKMRLRFFYFSKYRLLRL